MNHDPTSQPMTTTQAGGLGTLAMCAIGICGCYLYFGVLQERLFTGETRVGATFTLVTACLTNALVAVAWHKALDLVRVDQDWRTDRTAQKFYPRRPPLRHGLLFVTSFLYVMAMVCSNESIQYISYPVAVLAKSCKLIPTMLVGQLAEGRQYSREEWMAAFFISFGIALFHFSRMHMSAQNQPTSAKKASTRFGMSLLMTSLLMDGLLSSSQNVLMRGGKSYRAPSAIETMLYVNLYALVFLVPLSMVQGQWTEGMLAVAVSARQVHHSLLWNILMINLVVAVGQMFIFLTIQLYSSVVVTTITTTRKFLTILLSVWTFGHRFTPVQWTAISLVFAGLYLVIMVQHRSFTVTKTT
jgi:UDP-galactose transporter B1